VRAVTGIGGVRPRSRLGCESKIECLGFGAGGVRWSLTRQVRMDHPRISLEGVSGGARIPPTSPTPGDVGHRAIYHHLKIAARCAIEVPLWNCCVQSVMLKRFNLLFRQRLENCGYGTLC
jgi:hypothetical protein